MSQDKEREAGIQCNDCQGHCDRLFVNPSQTYVKHTYIGDVWERGNIKTGQDAVKANKERIKDMRAKTRNKNG